MIVPDQIELIDLQQGSPEWLSLRKKKITSTDASIIMGANHWKTRIQLYHEKLSDEPPQPANDRMKRGMALEPVARDLFNLQTGMNMRPAVLVKDFMMASLDGRDEAFDSIVEIKCPGEKDHSIALDGRVPDHYYPQIQHQIYVSGVEMAYYFSFDGIDGVIVTVKRDDGYIEKLIEEEKRFHECLTNKTPPEPREGDYVERDDVLWQKCSAKWMAITDSIKKLEKEEEEIRKQLIFLSGESNTKGAGISLCQVQRKGSVQYTKIPELKGVNLDAYRGESVTSWRITCA